MNEIPGRIVAPPEQTGGRRFLYGAIAVSLLLHAAVGVALIIEVNRQLPEAEAAPIVVELVTPPEAEQQELVLPEEITPGPEAAEEPPPPPPPPAQDQPQSEEELAELSSALPVMQPVVEFGEEDSGPRTDPDGVSAQDPDEAEPDEPTEPEAEASEAEAEQASDAEPAQPDPAETADTPEEREPPENPEPAAEPEQLADTEPVPEVLGTDAPGAILVPPEPKPAPDAATAEREESGEPAEMTAAEQLFSESITADERVQTAMKNMPRSERGNLLCMTELRAQLLAARPPRPPEFLPSYQLPGGTVLETHKAAFRSQGQWFDLAFRCEVNEGVTKVMNFSFRVGDAIPREQWSQRGFPSL